MEPNSFIRRNFLIIFFILIAGYLTTRLQNTAFIDEALYINAGHAYLENWFHGTPIPEGTGRFFSGAPVVYPVLAATLDNIAGLLLVRLFSLGCIILAGIFLYQTVKNIFSELAGRYAACLFLVTGAVLFVGHLATFDALCLMLLTLALFLGTRAGSVVGAFGMSLALTGAIIVKYTALAFVPVILAVVFLTTTNRFSRILLCLILLTLTLGTAWALWGDRIAADLAFTTIDRTALSPTSTTALVKTLLVYMGLFLLIGAIGFFGLLMKSWRYKFLALVLLGGTLLLPLGQIRMHEAVSFEKHTAYSAIFLSILMGWALSRAVKRHMLTVPVYLFLFSAVIVGSIRSADLYQWPNVTPVLAELKRNHDPGLYISSSTDSLKYHTRDYRNIEWQTTFTLYAEGNERIRSAVTEKKYEAVILSPASTGSSLQDEPQKLFIDELMRSPAYELKELKDDDTNYSWYLFTLRD